MIQQYEFNGMTIDIFNDPTYSLSSADNKINYAKHYSADGADIYPVSKHGIQIKSDGDILNSCIVIGSGGATGVTPGSTLLDVDKLLVCC